jgi:hypothetical protein
MEGIFYGHLVKFPAIWYILWPFSTFIGNFPRFGMVYQENLANLDIWAIVGEISHGLLLLTELIE